MSSLVLMIGTTELLLIGGIALLLFGGKKLPEMMRGLGKGVKEFKQGMREVDTPCAEQTEESSTDDENNSQPVKNSHPVEPSQEENAEIKK